MQILRLMVPVLLLILTACGGGGATTSPGNEYGTGSGDTTQTTGDGVDRSKLADTLYFYNWSDYIDPAILDQFKAEYGVEVVVDTYDSNEDMLAKVRAGNSGYDIVVPSDYAVQIMVAEGLAAPIDKSLLTNLVHIDPNLLDQYFDKGNVYSVPYMYGITGIAYNTKFFPNGIDSWAAIFEPDQIAQFAGKFSMLDDARETPGAALRYIGQSLNSADPAALERVKEILLTQKQYLAAYNSSDVNRKLASEEYVMAHSWSGTAMQARNGLGDEFSGNPNIAFVIPKEGGMIWMDNLAILKDSPNAYTAHVFINFLMRPEIAAQNAEYVGYLTPNKDALPLISAEVRELYAQGFAPDDAMYQRLEWAVRNEGTTAFDDLWTEIKGE